jgi:dipeptidyl-peptidase-4
MPSRALALFLICCAGPAAGAHKKPITLETLAAAKTSSEPSAAVWSPDGRQFVYTEAGKLKLYDIASRGKRDLVTLSALEAAAAKTPQPAQSEWVNRRVQEDVVAWLPSGHELLIAAGGDLFLLRIHDGGWTRLTETPEVEHDPKLSPDGRLASFRRGHDLYTMEIASRKVTRLTTDGSPTIGNGELDWIYAEEHGLLVVSGFEIHRLSAV